MYCGVVAGGRSDGIVVDAGSKEMTEVCACETCELV